MDFVIAVVGLPLCFLVVSLGTGLTIEWAAGVTLPAALLAPLGFAGGVVISLAVYTLALGGTVAVVLLVIATIVGFVLRRWDLAARLRPGWMAGACGAAYLLFVAPELFWGHWSWGGYNFVNDTAVQLLLIDHLPRHGTDLIPLRSTGAVIVDGFLSGGYPIGSHALLATLSQLMRTPPEILYQAFLACLAAVTAASVGVLAGRSGAGPRAAAAIGLVACAANLTYQYALQGNIKEMAIVAATAAAAATGREFLAAERPKRVGIPLAVMLAAMLSVYNAGAGPYVLALSGALAVGLLLVRGLRGLRPHIAGLAVAGVLALVLASPTLSTFSTFYRVGGAGATHASSGAPPLGQLARPLPATQGAGVWLSGQYILPVPHEPAATLTAGAIGLVLLLMLIGAGRLLRWREPGPLLLLCSTGLTLAGFGPQVTPYVAGKLLAIVGPSALLVAAMALIPTPEPRRLGLGRVRVSRAARLLRSVATVLGCGIGAAVLASDGLAYHYTQMAPVSRMAALADVGEHLRSTRFPELVYFNEFEEFTKYFARGIPVAVGTESAGLTQVALRQRQPFLGHYFDLDQQQLAYLETFPYIVLRLSPAASRPPANFARVYANTYYEVWRRFPSPRVVEHMPLQLLNSRALPAPCAQVRRLKSHGHPGDELIAAVAPPVIGFDTAHAFVRSPYWIPHPTAGGTVLPLKPGRASGKISLPVSGRYRVWLEGSLPRRIFASLDGHPIGSASNVNAPDQWLPVNSLQLSAGGHLAGLARPGGDLGPGNGADEAIGPLAFELQQPERLQPVPISQWRSLCGRVLDWIELVTPRGRIDVSRLVPGRSPPGGRLP